MLTTNPSERATMHEIMNHPWMTKGFGGPPENYLPERKPITLPLDPEVIAKMTGFDFGSPEYITSQLTAVIESEEYQRAVRLQEKRINQQPADNGEPKRGVFAFYKRRGSTTSKDTLTTPSTEALQLGTDPINAFSPFLSVYYLAREKLEREAREKNPGALAIPQSPGEQPLPMPDLAPPEAAYTNSQAYEMAGEKTGGRARPRARTHGEDEVADAVKGLNVDTAPSPVNPTIIEPPTEQKPAGHARKESAAVGLLRRFSKRGGEPRSSHPPPALAAYSNASSESGTPRKSMSMRRARDSSQTRDPASASGATVRPETAGPATSTGTTGRQGGLLSPPLNDASNERTKRHGLGRSISVNSSDMRRRLSRRGVSEGASANRNAVGGDSASAKDASSDVEGTVTRPRTTDMFSSAGRTRSIGSGHSRKESGATGSSQTAAANAAAARRLKRESATIPPRTDDVPEETDQELAEEEEDYEDLHQQASPRARGRMQDDPRRRSAFGPSSAGAGGNSGGSSSAGRESAGAANATATANGMKPIYLKGLFSSSTTTSRPLPVIRADLIRVLRELGVEFKEIRGGFACRHAPSVIAAGSTPAGQDEVATVTPENGPATSSSGGGAGGHRRKISFAFRGSTSAERSGADLGAGPAPSSSSSSPPQQQQPQQAGRVTKSAAGNYGGGAGGGYMPSDVESESDSVTGGGATVSTPTGPTHPPATAASTATTTPPTTTSRRFGGGGPRAAGETSTHVQSDLGGDLVPLRFEIVVVKVPLLSLHGIQFKKVDGGTWQYKNMAQKILGGLRL